MDCPLAVIDCAFKYAGCHERLCRKDMADHVATNLGMHMSLQAMNYHQELQKLQEQLKQQNEIIAKQQKELEEFNQILKLNEHVGILPLEFIVPKYSKLKESNSVWQSKPFYTHAHGYKLSLHVAPNGLRNAKGTHVSVFIYLMKGEFDEDLSWPLRTKINIFLIDHNLSSQFYDDAIAWQTFNCEDEKSDVCFARVINGEKSQIGWGREKFMPHSQIDPKYLKKDCLHFKLGML
jgi:TNF receptor-associated factor 4